MLLAVIAIAGGCAAENPETRAPARPPPLRVYASDLDVKELRAEAVVAPALVAIYVIDEQGDSTFDRAWSRAAGGSVNTLIRFTGVPTIDFKLVASTPMGSDEFYNRMDRATTRMVNHCMEESLCSKQAVRFPGSVSSKFATWDERLPATYVVFFSVVGAYRTPEAEMKKIWTVAMFMSSGIVGGVIGGIVAASMPTDGAIASASVVDVSNGEVVWFRLEPISNSRDIGEVRRAVAVLASNLF